jgi:hypothetical protein
VLTVTKPEQAHWVFDEDPEDEPDYYVVKALWNARIVPVPVASSGTAASSSSAGTWGSNTASLPPPQLPWL